MSLAGLYHQHATHLFFEVFLILFLALYVISMQIHIVNTLYVIHQMVLIFFMLLAIRHTKSLGNELDEDRLKEIIF